MRTVTKFTKTLSANHSVSIFDTCVNDLIQFCAERCCLYASDSFSCRQVKLLGIV